MAKGKRRENAISKMAREEGVSEKAIYKSLQKLRERGKALDLANPPENLTDARARLAAAQADEKERNNKVNEGLLVTKEAVEITAAETGAIIKGEIMNLGNKMGAVLAGKDAVEIKALLDTWANETLTAWAVLVGIKVDK